MDRILGKPTWMIIFIRSFNSAEALYEDLRFTRRCDELIERMAIVGDRFWKATWVAIFELFGAIDMACFDRTEAQAAWQWLQRERPEHAR
jgi:hypothetical protein